MHENSLYAHILSLTAPWKVLSLTLFKMPEQLL